MGKRKQDTSADSQDKTKKKKKSSARTFNLGIVRTIRGSLKRFVALAVICALGTAMLVGLTVACEDLRYSADDFFDDQKLFDIRVISTLGLSDEDIEALAEIDGVESVEGGWTETVYTTVGSGSEKVDVKALSASGVNEPYLIEGQLPVTDDQIAVTQGFIEDSGLSIGDTVTFHSEGDASDEEDTNEEDDESDEDTDADDEAEDADDESDEDTEDDADDAEDADTESEEEDSDAENNDSDDTEDDEEDTDDDSDDTTVFERKEYTIVGIVLDPMDINAAEGTMSFRSSGGSQYSFFVLPGCVTTDYYTVAYIRVEGSDDPLCYSDEYDDLVQAVMDEVEEVSYTREVERGEELRTEAYAEIDEAEEEALEELDEAQAEIDDAQAELDDAQAELDEGSAELAEGETELAESREEALAELDDAQAEIDEGYAELSEAETELVETAATLSEALEQIDDGLDQIDDAELELASGRAQLETAASMLIMFDLIPEDEWNTLIATTDPDEASTLADELNAEIEPTITEVSGLLDEMLTYVDYLDEDEETAEILLELIELAPEALQSELTSLVALGSDEAREGIEEIASLLDEALELAPGMAEVIAGEAELAETKAELEEQREEVVAAQDEIADAWIELAYNEATLDAGSSTLETERESATEELDAAEDTLADSAEELEDAQEEIDDAQAEIDDAQATLDEERADALAEIADAREEVAEEIGDAVWYIQDRSSLASFSSVDSDASSIESIADVIPIVFFVVAALISLTTMTRMVDEERTLIGLYKALGYSNGRILSKYTLYALASVLAGVLIGYLLGYIVLPLFLFSIFDYMYTLPSYSLHFDLELALLSFVLFTVCIVGATIWSCWRTLKESPADLMRPKAPKAGSRIFLERIKPLWKRLSFLNKVAARNIFRYKRRFLMTVVGIAGTTALLICGFGIKNTVVELSDLQYGDENGDGAVTEYDLIVVTSTDDLGDFADELDADDDVEGTLRIYTDSVTVSSEGQSVTAQLVVVPDGESLEGYVWLYNYDGDDVDLTEATSGSSTGALVTVNAESVLGFDVGDTVEITDSTLAEASIDVSEVVMAYLGNYVFMTQDAYEEAYDTEFEANGLLVNLTGSSDDQIAYSEELSLDSRVLSVVSTQKLIDDFSGSFTLMDTVVYIIIAFAAALSFTVVFTLSNTNISEREREIATIKVLGFKRNEVHTYINKETYVLTVVGIIVGLPLGYFLTGCLEWVLKMPSLYFAVTIYPSTYVIAAFFAVLFTIIVSQMTNRTLDRVDMVGALKSAE